MALPAYAALLISGRRSSNASTRARAAERREERRKAERAKEREQEGGEETFVEEQHLFLPGSIRSSSDIEALITQLNGFLELIQAGKSIHVTCRIIDEGRERIAHTYP